MPIWFPQGHPTKTLLYYLSEKGMLTGITSSFWLLDVNAAFDTIDDVILLKCLQLSLGLSSNFITWLSSFLDGHSLCAVHETSKVVWVPAPHGLPGGSVLLGHLYNDEVKT